MARPRRSAILVRVTAETLRVIEQVRSFAGALGLACAPLVVADRSNLVLALEPHPVVARVAMATSAARVGMAWLAREVEVSRFLGPTLSTQPARTIDPGPHEVDGLVVSFWERERLRDRLSPADAGAQLAACHRALARFPGALPFFGAWEEARAVHAAARRSVHLDAHEKDAIARGFDRAERIVADAPARSASMQAIHGDAHLGNVLAVAPGGWSRADASGAARTLWTDWEDAFVGPIEYDLCSLRARAVLFGEDREAIDAALAAYDVPHDAALVDALGLVRNVQVIVWLALFAERQPELVPRLRARVAALPGAAP